jgi:hypothetical protein
MMELVKKWREIAERFDYNSKDHSFHEYAREKYYALAHTYKKCANELEAEINKGKEVEK